MIKEKCSKCAGSGYIANRKKIKVSIPAGIDNGQSVRIRDKGEPGVKRWTTGDLLVEVNVSAHPSLKRQDIHIFLNASDFICGSGARNEIFVFLR